MRFTATVADPRAALKGTEEQVARSVTAGMREITEGLKEDLRSDVRESGLGQRLANTWRGQTFPRTGESAEAAAYVSTNAPKLIDAFDRGVTITARGGNPASTAWGYGQITVDAETDIRKLIPGFDRKDPNQAVMGAAAYLSLRQKWAGGDLTKALDGYGTGPGYGIDIMRRAGQMGDASSLGVARDLDAQSQAAERSQEVLRRNTELYGRNGAQLEASTRAAELYQDMLARGVPPSEALRKSLEGFALSAEQASRATRLVQFARDDDFAREQLGRNRIDQQAYAAARARFGDTTSPEARAAIDRSRNTMEMAETKAALSDGVTSFVTDLRRGGDAATALSNAFGNFTDRLLSKVMDNVISGIFDSATKGGGNGGLGGIISALVGGGKAGGGYTGPGDRYDLAGFVHRGEVVYSQDDVARHGGVAAVEAFRRNGGMRGYADGGVVGRDAFTMPSAAAMRPANGNALPPINFIDQRPAGSPEMEPAVKRRSDGGIDVIVRTMEGRMGQRAAAGQGPFKQAAGGAGYRIG